MAKKKENFKDMKAEDLKKKLQSLREELRILNFKSEGARSKNVKESLNLRKQVARILTVFNQKK